MKRKYFYLIIFCLLLTTLTTASASEKVTATPADNYAYYGSDTPAGQTHSFAIQVDNNVYYITDSTADKLATYSYSFRQVYEYDLQKYSNKFTPDAVSFGSNGLNAYYRLDDEVDDEMFIFENDKSFDFEYASGQKVGYNKNAKVITKIYYPDGREIT